MADPAKVGTPWRDDELDAIVADYFNMLAAELSRSPYVKTKHSHALMAKIGRTHRSVEFKHQNISAVLDELGLPWIPGYIPKRNYQKAIFPAIERYLSANPSLLNFVPQGEQEPEHASSIFVEPPVLMPSELPPAALQRLVQKFDPVERDHRNRTLGRAGEEFVVELERKRLFDEDRRDLARKIRWIADEEGDGAGYDVLSFDRVGTERWIEVKTTNGSAKTPFFLSRNEMETSRVHSHWCVYRVHQFATEARVFVLKPPLEQHLHLATETWRASFRS